jgi:hypothetical protein
VEEATQLAGQYALHSAMATALERAYWRGLMAGRRAVVEASEELGADMRKQPWTKIRACIKRAMERVR